MKSVVIVDEDSVSAPSSVVQCVREFVAVIRNDYENLAPVLARALDAEPELVGQLLEQLEILFVEELLIPLNYHMMPNNYAIKPIE